MVRRVHDSEAVQGGASPAADRAPARAARTDEIERREEDVADQTAETGEATEPEEAGEASLLALSPHELRAALEAVLFALSEPISIRALAELFETTVHDVRAAVEALREEYVDLERAFRIEDIAGGVQLLTDSRYDPWIRRLRKKSREGRLSPAALETLSVIAYKQPIHKADLEAIRGVACGPILKTLLDRGLVQIVGRAEGLGKPLLYGTTKRFLESFGLHSIRELPQPDLDAAREISAGQKAAMDEADEEPSSSSEEEPEEAGARDAADGAASRPLAADGGGEDAVQNEDDDDKLLTRLDGGPGVN